MSELIRRVIKSEVKGVDPKNFTVDVTMSDETIDRYKEVIRASAWKKGMDNYKAHPVLLSSHNYHGLMNQIGEAVTIGVKGGKLQTKFKYYVDEDVPNPEASWGWVLASKGVAAYSVGFIRKAGFFVGEGESAPKGVDEDEYKAYQKAGVRYVYTDVELLECSHVLVPANPSCLQNSYEQGPVMRSLEEQAFPMMAELEAALKALPHKKEDEEEQKSVEEIETETSDEFEEADMSKEELAKMMEGIQKDFEAFLVVQVKQFTDALEVVSNTYKDEFVKMFGEDFQKKVDEVFLASFEKLKPAEVTKVEEETVNEKSVEEAKQIEEKKSSDAILNVFKELNTELEKTFNVPS